ncbi:MAG: hypothetical protein GC159_17140 [Phycisphaera sp.]|nr:hypothetical protein [Phycisphaera sp.]
MEFDDAVRYWFDEACGPVTAERFGDIDDAMIHELYHRSVLPMVLHVSGRQVLHASAVYIGAGVVGICGVSGAGKSTLAYALQGRGQRVWADDACCLSIAEDHIDAIALPHAVRLTPEAFDAVAQMPRGDEGFSVTDRAAPVPADSAPLTAVLVLEPHATPDAHEAGPVVRADRLSGKRAFAALLPHAYTFTLDDPGVSGPMMRQYMRLAAAVPVYRVSIRRGFDLLPRACDELLRLLDATAVSTSPR